jgi:integrase
MENIMANDTTTPGEHPELGARFPEREFYLMMYLLMGLGLRRHEILSLRAGSIDVERGILTVPSPKTLTTRKVPVSPILAGMLAVYLKGRAPGRLAARYWLDRLRKHLPWS